MQNEKMKNVLGSEAALNSWPHVDTPMSSKPLLSETKDDTSGTGAVKRIDPTKGIVFKRVFVTGASGFVGRTLVKYLNDNAICKQVVALARSDVSEAKAKRAGAWKVVRGDLQDVKALREGMAGCDAVFHLAADLRQWSRFYDAMYETNVIGTRNVIKAAVDCKVARFVHCSTEATLVGGSQKVIDADESMPYGSRSRSYPYTATKILAEEVVRSAKGIETVVCRPRLIWGLGDTVMMTKVISAVRSGDWKWFSGGTYKTSTCHVRNVCEGMVLAAKNGTPGAVYFLTDGKSSECKRFYTEICATQGVRIPDRSIPFWLVLTLAVVLEWIYGLCCCCSTNGPVINRQTVRLICEEVTVRDQKARKELGYVGHVTYEQGMTELKADYLTRLDRAD